MNKRILMLESFYSGSHRAFADGLVKYSENKIDLLTMPARFWKWRMKGSALYFAEKLNKIEEYDLIFTTDLINIADLKVLLGRKCPPVILYFHENQLAYPLNKQEKLDYHYGLTDLTNSLAAECVIFNSHTHMNTFLEELPLFIRHMPDFIPLGSIEKIKEKSLVLYPGIEESAKSPREERDKSGTVPVIVWNHRWEFDKNPEDFFNILFRLKKEKVAFKLILLGESYNKQPRVFKKAEGILKEEIIHSGYLEKYEDYTAMLKLGNIVVSTSNQENYGIAVIEAILSGCTPLLPNRLSYPEIIPEEFHRDFLYTDYNDLVSKLKIKLKGDKDFKQRRLADRMSKLYWSNYIINYDNLFSEIIEGVL